MGTEGEDELSDEWPMGGVMVKRRVVPRVRWEKSSGYLTVEAPKVE